MADISIVKASPKKLKKKPEPDAQLGFGKIFTDYLFLMDYKKGEGDWKRMKRHVTDFYGLDRDKFNVVRPAATLTCDAIKIRILPTVGYCMGVHQIRIEFQE